MAEKRAHWHEQFAAELLYRLEFVDESGAKTKMTRLYGRAVGGRRLVGRIPWGSYQTSTLISGIRLRARELLCGTNLCRPCRGLELGCGFPRVSTVG